MSQPCLRKKSAAADPAPGRSRRRGTITAAPAEGLPREHPPEEPYRPELVARLERAVRQGCYRPDASAIAQALLDRIDSLQ